MKSNKPIKKEYEVLGKRMYIFPEEYANDFDPVTRKKCMVVSINDQNTYVPVGEPVDITYEVWSLLKNIGRIGKVVGVPIVEKKEDETE